MLEGVCILHSAYMFKQNRDQTFAISNSETIAMSETIILFSIKDFLSCHKMNFKMQFNTGPSL